MSIFNRQSIHAIKRGVRFDYLLVDSWFTSTKSVRLITGRHVNCYLLGMIKLPPK